jgi:DNA-binding CsgD family transcriptional regulator
MGGTIIETESERVIRIERCKTIKRMLSKGKTPEEISDLCDYDLSYVREVEESMLQKA